MAQYELTLWQSPNGVQIQNSATVNISTLTDYMNDQIVPLRDKMQIQKAFEAELYAMATEFTWHRAINHLKSKIMTFGKEFVLEMLGRVDENLSEDFLTDIDTINLATDLGFINNTAKMYFLQSKEIIQHFSNPNVTGELEPLDSLRTIKICIQYVLALDEVNVEFSYNNFRETLTEQIIQRDDMIVQQLIAGPYFFKRTTIRTLLNLSKTHQSGAQKEKVLSNTVVVISEIWEGLLSEDKWPIGFAYAEAINSGNKDIVKALKSLLLKVQGFDFVPENLRSASFIEVANLLLSSHYEMNNFYKEAIPAKQLSQMGSSIPKPAIGKCMTSVIICKLGNRYGRANAAQIYLDSILDNLIPGSWSYYINEVLYADEHVLQKIAEYSSIRIYWFEMIAKYRSEFEGINIKNKSVDTLIEMSKRGDDTGTRNAANALLTQIR